MEIIINDLGTHGICQQYSIDAKNITSEQIEFLTKIVKIVTDENETNMNNA